MEVIYSREAQVLKRGQVRFNPRFFAEPISGATKVYLDGDWPLIGQTYAALGVEVVRIDALEVHGSAAELPPHEPGAVIIPDGWEQLPWNDPDGPSLRAVATAIRGAAVPNKAEAAEVIQAELERRAQ